MDKMEWIDSVYESLLFRGWEKIASTYQGSSGMWWWSVTDGDLSYSKTRELAKAAVEKEVGK